MSDDSPYDPKAYWTERGRSYKQDFHMRYERILRESGRDRNQGLIFALLGEAPFRSFLDIGCGYGLYLKGVEDRFANLQRIVGCDISPTQLDEARHFLGPDSRVELMEVDGESLPYPDESFDVCLTYGVGVHVPHERIHAFLTEILRVTRGRYLFLESGSEAYERTSKYYFAHDYEAIFSELGYRTELLAELDPAVKECLRRVVKS